MPNKVYGRELEIRLIDIERECLTLTFQDLLLLDIA